MRIVGLVLSSIFKSTGSANTFLISNFFAGPVLNGHLPINRGCTRIIILPGDDFSIVGGVGKLLLCLINQLLDIAGCFLQKSASATAFDALCCVCVVLRVASDGAAEAGSSFCGSSPVLISSICPRRRLEPPSGRAMPALASTTGSNFLPKFFRCSHSGGDHEGNG